MKQIILSIFFLFSKVSELYALETEKTTSYPLNLQIFFRRNSSFTNTFEESIYMKTFSTYIEDKRKDSIVSYDIGFRKKIADSNFSFDVEFSELKKGGYPIATISCSRVTSACNDYSIPSGTYYRSQVRSMVNYEVIPNVFRLSGGIRYIRSELSDGYIYSYSLNFGQKYAGPELGFEVESPKFWNFNLKFNYSYFLLGGKISYSYATPSRTGENGYISFLSEPKTKYYGQQLGLKLNYFIEDHYYISLGISNVNAKVRTNSINIYSQDIEYDNFINTKFRTVYGNSFRENIYTVYFELGLMI